jgi:carboxypeptidase T
MTKGIVWSVVTFFLIFSTNVFSLENVEVILSYEVKTSPFKMMKIAERFEVVGKVPNGFIVYVLKQKRDEFLKLAPNAKLISSDIHEEFSEKAVSQYRKFVDVEKDLKEFENQFPQYAKLKTYGKSKEGRVLYALEIKKDPTTTYNKKILITAATHGDELITTEVLFNLTREMLEGLRNNDARFLKMVDNKSLTIIPVVSPDSFEKRIRYVQNVDPNRSFPWPDSPSNKSVDVISSLITFFHQENFAATLDLHAYGKLVMFPWGYTKEAPVKGDEIVMKDLVEAMARENQYEAGQISTTIYIAKGSSADYFYWKNKSKAIAVEIGREKVPDYKQIPKIVNESREMIWTFIELN